MISVYRSVKSGYGDPDPPGVITAWVISKRFWAIAVTPDYVLG